MSHWTTHRARFGLLVLVTLAGILLAWGAVRAAPLIQPTPPGQPAPPSPTPQALFELPDGSSEQVDQQGRRQREPGSTEAPEISFIDSPTATCYLPKPGTDACYITWNYLYVTAGSSQYIITMTVAIENHLRANFQGFFQTSMYVPYDMLSPGFRVSCGTPGSGGNPYLGRHYAYTIRARESGGLRSANFGTARCPADWVLLDSLGLSGPGGGVPDTGYEFNASVYPITATLPVTYVWQATGQAAITMTAGITSAQTYSWTTAGVKTIHVSASNPVSTVTQTHTITIDPNLVPMTSVGLSGPTSGSPGSSYYFTASAQPLTASTPITYVWQVTGHAPITETAGLSAIRSFAWTTTGTKSVQLTASNPVSSHTQTRTILIAAPPDSYVIYLPMMRR